MSAVLDSPLEDLAEVEGIGAAVDVIGVVVGDWVVEGAAVDMDVVVVVVGVLVVVGD